MNDSMSRPCRWAALRIYVSLTACNTMDMHKQEVAWQLGLPTGRDRASAFCTIRAEASCIFLEGKQQALLVADKVHHLRNDVLEECTAAHKLQNGLTELVKFAVN